MSDHKEFFRVLTGKKVNARFYECDEYFTVEDLYQAFKSRLAEESKDKPDKTDEINYETVDKFLGVDRHSPYGFCPICGSKGVSRERRLNGDDRCAQGHRYPSSTAKT